jgi:hypothetical protein
MWGINRDLYPELAGIERAEGETYSEWYARESAHREAVYADNKAFVESVTELFKTLKRAEFGYARQGITSVNYDPDECPLVAYTGREAHERRAERQRVDIDLGWQSDTEVAIELIGAAALALGLAYRVADWRSEVRIYSKRAVEVERRSELALIAEVEGLIAAGVWEHGYGSNKVSEPADEKLIAEWEKSLAIVKKRLAAIVEPDWAAHEAARWTALYEAAVADDAEWTRRKRELALREFKTHLARALKYGASSSDIAAAVTEAAALAKEAK